MQRDWCPHKKKFWIPTDEGGRWPCRDRGREWSNVIISQRIAEAARNWKRQGRILP